MKYTLSQLRNVAILHSLFTPTSLSLAIRQLGFVQADPIRSPARAQDLILRLRAANYRVGDLEKNYSKLEIEEDFLYAYGFITRDLQQYLYPRRLPSLNSLEKKIFRVAQQSIGPLDGKELERVFGRTSVTNAWGGSSKAIKVALENLHYAGLLRVSGRDKGRRIYAANNGYEKRIVLNDRLEKLILAIVHILYPISQRTLHEALTRTRQHIGNTKPVIEKLVRSGVLERHVVDHMIYIWPKAAIKEIAPVEISEVRFLAPFDPLVWDRRRFEHLWGWPYRFEGYTPPAKRNRGYYAMPLLWREQIVGWVNIKADNNKMVVDIGYINAQPKDPSFKTELKKEYKRMEEFLLLNR